MALIEQTELVKNTPIGTILWRSFKAIPLPIIGKNALAFEMVHFEPSDFGGYMVRCLYPGELTAEPSVHCSKDTPFNEQRGVIVFVKELPPDEQWNYLIVTGVSKNGTALFAKVGGWSNSYLELRKHILMTKAQTIGMSTESSFQFYCERAALNLPEGLNRLFVKPTKVRELVTTPLGNSRSSFQRTELVDKFYVQPMVPTPLRVEQMANAN